MTTEHNDLDAIRTIVDTLSPFEADEQQRILRWALEKLGLTPNILTPAPQAPSVATAHPTVIQPATTPNVAHQSKPKSDIKSFISNKNPTNDMHFAAAVAYYYAFEAQDAQKKEEVGSSELQEACRLTNRERLANPGQTLRNAAYNGLLDKGTEKGSYKINTVGENLVALTLPEGETKTKAKTPRKKNRKPAKKAKAKPAKKAAAKVNPKK